MQYRYRSLTAVPVYIYYCRSLVTGKSSEEPEHGKLRNPDVRERHGKTKKAKERMRQGREKKKFKIPDVQSNDVSR